ncbi:hypothetical protein SAMN00120144_4246 [Hymenobacter roseosalivarius DSM 11622]|uniref:Phosphoribosylpyrophosphate synthetase n=1 Tax=Hymenobacter roseosalivarius DSM 11622 TaxID=645990 RepID=A0A1W1UPY7_9BACT|nr:hypothetical protein [Hymenobacter roseosalivarius]SMB83208.1 hypothetical protein SAMN00120144_4246 [Hymenobacter roseosalivarius DSM 11622]
MQDKEEERSLIMVEQKLAKDGFTEDFRVADGRLRPFSSETISYGPEDVTIVDFYRFEGESDPDDMSILYALECADGTRGTISSSYGPTGDTDSLGFLKQVEDLGKNLKKDHK